MAKIALKKDKISPVLKYSYSEQVFGRNKNNANRKIFVFELL